MIGFVLLLYLSPYVLGRIVVTVEIVNIETNVIALAPGWNITLKSDVVSYINDICPAGMYCPAMTSIPIPCALGTYSVETGLDKPCTQLCPVNFYCPSPTIKNLCPAHTVTRGNGTSKADCLCESGYLCTYRKQTNVQVMLHLPLEKWLHNSTLQGLVRQAVADAAGVGLGNVVVDYVVPSVSTALKPKRNMLGTAKRWRGAKLLNVNLIVFGKGMNERTWGEVELGKHLSKLEDSVVAVGHHVQVTDYVRVRKGSWNKT